MAYIQAADFKHYIPTPNSLIIQVHFLHITTHFDTTYKTRQDCPFSPFWGTGETCEMVFGLGFLYDTLWFLIFLNPLYLNND